MSSVPKTREDIIRIVEICQQFRCPLTMRGGGTSQGGQAIGEGLQVDTSKYYNQILELNVAERWVRVQPGIVLDELNAQLKPHGLRFAPDISTASRATIGGMMANNSSGARSVLYGKTIDHVLEQQVVLSDGRSRTSAQLTDDELTLLCLQETPRGRVLSDGATRCAEIARTKWSAASRRCCVASADTISMSSHVRKPVQSRQADRRLRRHAWRRAGSEAATWSHCRKRKPCSSIQFQDTLEALAATPVILEASAVGGRGNGRVHPETTRSRALPWSAFAAVSSKAIPERCCVSSSTMRRGEPAASMDALETGPARLAASATHFHRAIDLSEQARIWSLREAALGLSMAMKEEAKSISFVEDTAVAPERLRDYIDRFLGLSSKARNNRRHLRSRVRRMPARRPGRQPQNRAGHRHLRSDRQRCRGPGARVRRRTVGRTWRRTRAKPVHAQDVRPEAVRGFPDHQARRSIRTGS